MAENEIKELIISNLDNVSDIAISGKDCNFSIQIVSKDFSDMSLIDRHKKIMRLFKDFLHTGTLHAVSLDLRTPEEA